MLPLLEVRESLSLPLQRSEHDAEEYGVRNGVSHHGHAAQHEEYTRNSARNGYGDGNE